MGEALTGIREGEEAAGEIRMGIALEIERERLGQAFEPDFAAHDSFGAVIELAAHYAVVNSKCHESRLRI
jgi:hypothetical protein